VAASKGKGRLLFLTLLSYVAPYSSSTGRAATVREGTDVSRNKKRERPDPAGLGLPAVGVDSHAHLDIEDFAPQEVPEILARARAAGVVQIGNVFMGPDALAAHQALFDRYPEVFFLLGVHPCDAPGLSAADMAAMEEAFGGEPRLKALGEIGLDYYWDATTRSIQIGVFRDQLALARERSLPVVIHSRSADADTLAVLDDMGFRGRPLLWHCFSGGPDLLEAVLGRGFFVSVPGPVTYAKNTAMVEAVRHLPLSRLLLETDSPYLAPEPWRGKRNEPAFSAFTAVKVAEIMQLPPDVVWRTAGDNARRFFGLEPPADMPVAS